MTDDEDEYMDFVDEVNEELERSVEQFRLGESGGAVRSLANAVTLCESHPSFALRQHVDIGVMRDMVETCIKHSMRRLDVGANLSALLPRIRALARSGLH